VAVKNQRWTRILLKPISRATRRDLAAIRELHRVTDEVEHDLAEAFASALIQGGDAAPIRSAAQGLRLGRAGGGSRPSGGRGRRARAAAARAERAGLDGAEVDEVVDEPGPSARRAGGWREPRLGPRSPETCRRNSSLYRAGSGSACATVLTLARKAVFTRLASSATSAGAPPRGVFARARRWKKKRAVTTRPRGDEDGIARALRSTSRRTPRGTISNHRQHRPGDRRSARGPRPRGRSRGADRRRALARVGPVVEVLLRGAADHADGGRCRRNAGRDRHDPAVDDEKISGPLREGRDAAAETDPRPSRRPSAPTKAGTCALPSRKGPGGGTTRSS